MDTRPINHDADLVELFNQDLSWWGDVYRDDLPMGFFSFEMRRRLYLVSEHLISQIKSMDNPDVLECGCGPGEILKLIAPLRCKLTGIDLNPRYVDLAVEKAPNAVIRQSSVEHLPFPNESFDIVYAVGLLQYLKSDHNAAREITRVTKYGGIILLSVPNYTMLHLIIDPYYLFRCIKKVLKIYKKQINTKLDEDIVKRYTLKKLVNIFDENEITLVRTMTTSFGPLRFWRRRFMPLSFSIQFSEALRKMSEYKIFSILRHLGNHWIIILKRS